MYIINIEDNSFSATKSAYNMEYVSRVFVRRDEKDAFGIYICHPKTLEENVKLIKVATFPMNSY